MLTRMIRRKLQMRFQMNHHKLTPLPLKKLLWKKKRMKMRMTISLHHQVLDQTVWKVRVRQQSLRVEGVTTDEGIVGSDDDVESEKELQKNHNNDIIETEQSEQLIG